MDKNYLVSICIPTYNGEKYIAETLQSISVQTFRNFEVIISDNLSSDRTLEIVQEWKIKQDFLVSVYSNQNIGIGNNWNFCLGKATGKYVKYLFQDDLLREDCLQIMMEFFAFHKNIKFLACKRSLIDNSKNVIAANNWMIKYGNLQSQFMQEEKPFHILTKKLFKQNYFFSSPTNKIGEPSAVMFEKNIIKKVGIFSTKYRQILDFEYWYRVLIHYDIAILNEELISFRLHDLQETNLNRTNNVSEYSYYNDFIKKKLFWYVSNSRKIEMLEEKHIFFSYIINFFKKCRKIIGQ